ncbi:MAG TPA: serine/threonine-protein kinase [Streptosporangiaceae bacterium]|jgi:predicted Ser/Thr protein kinase|nr:serine/threonine-protein kinase [Streptosporangiaceae bacterium]
MAAAPLTPEDPRIVGAYRLAGRLGEGGQGVVYLGYGRGDEPVAVKILKADADAKVRERLARELAACERVAPFCTARVLDSGVVGARPYVVSEYVDGPSLQQRVDGRGPLRDGELDRLVVGTATALTAIHGAGVLHRDLKPANVLLGPDGPRVVDFGIARPLDSGTITSQLIGTPAYLAPEQLGGQGAAPSADVFAWASTIVFAATGRPPFGNDTIPAVLNRIAHAPPNLAGVPQRFQHLLDSCLSKDPRVRPTARELLMRLVDPAAGADAIGHTGAFIDQAATQVLREPRPSAWAQTTMPAAEAPNIGPARRRRGGYALGAIGIGALASLLLGFAGLRYMNADDGAGDSPPTASAVARANVVPERFDGTWRGQVRQNNTGGSTSTFVVQITLRAGQRGGSLEIPENPCNGALELQEADDTELSFQLTFSTGSCLDGAVTLTMRDGDLRYRWKENSPATSAASSSEGILRRAA